MMSKAAAKSAPPPVQGKKRGCLFWGCLTSAIVAVLVAVVAAVIVFRVKRVVENATSTQPAPIPAATPSPQAARDTQRKTEGFLTALKRNEAGTFNFSADDINNLIATAPGLQDLRGRTFVAIANDRIVADASIPLDQVPGMQGRFLNGRFTLELQFRNGDLAIYARDIQVKGQPLPDLVKAKVETINLAQELYKRPDAVQALKKIDFLEVRDGKLVVRTRRP